MENRKRQADGSKKNKPKSTHSAEPVQKKVPVPANSSKNQPSTSGHQLASQSKTNEVGAGNSNGNSKGILKILGQFVGINFGGDDETDFADARSDVYELYNDSDDEEYDSDDLRKKKNKRKKPYDIFDEIYKIKAVWNDDESDHENTNRRGLFDCFAAEKTDENDDPMIPRPELSDRDTLSSVISMAVKHRMSHEAVLDLFPIFRMMFPEKRLPDKKEDLWKALKGNFMITRHYYCKKCQYYFGRKNAENVLTSVCPCGACGPDKSEEHLDFFFYINLKQQIEQLLKTPNIARALKYRFQRVKESSDTLEDIYDGEEYRLLSLPGKFLEHWNNLSLTFNTDVCKVNESSYARVWPVYAEINELPPHLRRKHMLLAAVYVDRKPPIVNNLLRPFTVEMKKLHCQGITWKPTKTSEITSKFMVIASSLSSPIRDLVTRLAEPDDLYGCLHCTAEGQRLAPGKIVYPFGQQHKVLKTEQKLTSFMGEVLKNGVERSGDNGYLSLQALPLFNVSKGVVVESMTAVFLGVVKMHTTLMLITPGTSYYIGDEATLDVIDKCLLSIKPPSLRALAPHSIKDHAQWRPADWRNWLEYAPVCLKDVLDEKYIDHLALLSEAIYYLNNDKITPAQLDRADDLLKDYVRLFEELFGTDKMTINVHSLTHLTQTVRNLGPLWAHNALTFESWNKRLMDRVMRSKGLLERIVLRFLMIKFADQSVFDSSLATRMQGFVKRMMNSNDDNSLNGVGKTFVGQGRPKERGLSREERTLLQAAGYKPNKLIIYEDVLLNGIKFSCKSTEKATKFSDSLVFNDDDGSFGLVERIVQFHHHDNLISGLIIQPCEQIDSEFRVRHIHKIVVLDKRRFITESTAIRPAVKMSTGEGTYAVRLVNCWETN